MDEASFIARLRGIATHPAARSLRDDVALLAPPPGQMLVLTHDMIAQGVHFLSGDPPADVAWKLAAVNLSDLAAKGAAPLGALLGYPLSPEPGWDEAFLDGLAAVLARFGLPLLGGDTVLVPAGAPRILGLTAIGGVAPGGAPPRSGARPGDTLWVAGAIGDAGLGLRIARGDIAGPAHLLAAYRRPRPLLAEGTAIAPLAHAMSDVSDGLLIDAERMADASGLALAIDLDAVPLSPEAIALTGDDRAARLAAATAGDDYALLAAAPDEHRAALAALGAMAIGRFSIGAGIRLADAAGAIPLPERLGYLHGAAC